jgi:hypothetical protein
MKDSYDLMKSLLKNSFGYHDILKRFIKAPSYGQILFHKKGDINETIVELDVNSLNASTMTIIKIPKDNPISITRLESKPMLSY